MKILYVGQLENKGTCSQRAEVFRDLGHTVVEVDTPYPYGPLYRISPTRLLRKFGYQFDWYGVNHRITELASSDRYDILWVDKGLYVYPATLNGFRRAQPTAKIVSYSLDDMMNPNNASKNYHKCIPIYDLHVTSKSYNASELLEQGARRTLFVSNAYNRDSHRPIDLTPEDRQLWDADVSFIGAYERDRAEQIRMLAESGVAVVVYCPQWDTALAQHPNIKLIPKFVLNDDYAKAIYATKVNLGFLRKANRDLQTTRSTEIPACGGFMLAERTVEHQMLFEEGIEAAYFGDSSELIEKTKYYLEHECERIRIARNGRERCLRDGYSYHDQLRKILAALSE